MTKRELLAHLDVYPDDTEIMLVVGVSCEDSDIEPLNVVRAPSGRAELSRISPASPVVVLDRSVL